MYICSECLYGFEAPEYIDCSFLHAYGTENTGYKGCPRCECDEFEEAEDCPLCDSGIKRSGDLMCKSCRDNLYRRLDDFFGALSYEEKLQFERWTDGDSVFDIAKWEV